MGFEVEYPNLLNSTEKVAEEKKIKTSVVSALNVSETQVDVKLLAASMRRKILGIKYNADTVVSGLSTTEAQDVVAFVNSESFVQGVSSAIGQNITVTKVTKEDPATSAPTTSAPTPASKAMTKAVFMYWNIMVLFLAFC